MAFEDFDVLSEGFDLFIDEEHVIYKDLKGVSIGALAELLLDPNQVVVGFPERFEIQAEGSGLHKASEAFAKFFRHCRDIRAVLD